MAGGIDLGGGAKGGRKPVDATINLVPFIDLMAVTISFLIMTAVWTQVARLQARQTGGPDGDRSSGREVPTLVADASGLRLRWSGGETVIPSVQGRFDICGVGSPKGACAAGSLIGALEALKGRMPEQTLLTLEVTDEVRYDELVRVLDACNRRDEAGRALLFPDVSVAPAG